MIRMMTRMLFIPVLYSSFSLLQLSIILQVPVLVPVHSFVLHGAKHGHGYRYRYEYRNGHGHGSLIRKTSTVALNVVQSNNNNNNNDSTNKHKKKYKQKHKHYRKRRNTKRRRNSQTKLSKEQQHTKLTSNLFHQFQIIRQEYDQGNEQGDGHDIEQFITLLSNIENNILNAIWSCQTVSQVHSILYEMITTAKIHMKVNVDVNTDGNDKGLLLKYEDLHWIGPNIASAALRRIVDVQQQQQQRHRHPQNTDDNIVNDDSMAEQYIPMLLQIVSQDVLMQGMMDDDDDNDNNDENMEEGTCNIQSLSSPLSFFPFYQWIEYLDEINYYLRMKSSSLSTTSTNINTSRDASTSVSASTTSAIPMNKIHIFEPHMTHYSCVNTLHSLSTLSRTIKKQLLQQKQGNGSVSSTTTSSSSSEMIETLNMHLLQLVNNICLILLTRPSCIVDDNKEIKENKITHTTDTNTRTLKVQQLTPQRSLETLSSLATLIQFQKSNNHNKNNDNFFISNNIDDDSENDGDYYDFSYENDDSEDDDGNVDDQINTMMNSSSTTASSATTTISELIKIIGNRLSKGDAIGQFNGYELSIGLWSLCILQTFNYDMIQSFMRRLRKKAIRESMTSYDICKSIWAIGQLMEILDGLQHQEQQQLRGIDIDNMDDYNGDNELLNYGPVAVDKQSVDTMDHDEMAIIFDECETCCYTLLKELIRNQNNSNNVAETSNGIWEQTDTKMKIQSLHAGQIADILSTCLIFEVDSDEEIITKLISHVQHVDDLNKKCSVTDIARILWSMQRLKVNDQAETVPILIKRYIHYINSHEYDAKVPKTLNTVLRSIVMILPDNGRDEIDLFNSVSSLFTDKNYLQKCNEFEVSNFAFVLAMADYYDKDVLKALSERMLDRDIMYTCTPSSASRFLWSLSSLVNKKEDYEMDELLFEMFQSLGGILLSSQLTPVDATSAMWAIAKSSYSLDMGIFDHLAEMLARDSMLERATVQQVCHALWACGKMMNFEDPLKEKIEYGEVTPPPYKLYATKYATFLVSLIDQMSSKDVAQAVWAMGRLKITDMSVLFALAMKASKIASEKGFNSQELANVIWGLSKTEYRDEMVLSILTKQMRDEVILEQSTPQEAANVMYALGRMMVRDEETFSCMNEVVMRNLDQATTQAIANTLWAHDRVNLTPPQQLFDSWAKEKLDIVGLYLHDRKLEVLEE